MNATSFVKARKRQRKRQLDEVERLSDTECTLSTSLNTKETGSDTAAGIIIPLDAKQTIDVLTLEFYVTDPEEATIPGVQVFYRSGEGFAEAINQPDEWTELANTAAQIIPGLRPRAIIPASDFTPVTLETGGVHALYVVFPFASTVKVKNVATTLIGSSSFNDGVVDVQTGISMERTATFPESYSSASQFSGILHYGMTKQCQSIKTKTDVSIEFALDTDPSGEVTDGLAGAVEEAVLEYMDDNPILAEFQEFYYLSLQKAVTSFQGRSDACPPDFTTCSLFSTTVTMSHLPALESGELNLGILGGWEAIEKSVAKNSPVGLVYGGDSLVSVDFLITLFGVPSGHIMNPVQRRYFEGVTMDTLKDARGGPPIHTAMSIKEVPNGGKRSQPSSRFLRGTSQRELQSDGKLQVLAQITSSGAIADVRKVVLESLEDDENTYHTKLVTQFLGPGEINESNFEDFFGDIDKVEVQIKPVGFGDEPDVVPATGNAISSGGGATESSFSVWVVVCFILILMSMLTILYRVYKDCFSSSNRKQKVPMGAVATQPMDSGEEVDDSDLDSVSIADLSAGDQEPEDEYSFNELNHEKIQESDSDDESASENDVESSCGSEEEEEEEEEDSELTESDMNDSESEDSEIISRGDHEPGFSSPKSKKSEKTQTIRADTNSSDEESEAESACSEESDDDDDDDDDTQEDANDKKRVRISAKQSSRKPSIGDKSDASKPQSIGGISIEEFTSDSESESESAAEESVGDSSEESEEDESHDESSIDPDDIEVDGDTDESSSQDNNADDDSSEESSDESGIDPDDIEDENVAESFKRLARAPRKGPKNQSGQKGRGVQASKSMPDTTVPLRSTPQRKQSLSTSKHSTGGRSVGSNSSHASNKNMGTPRNKAGANGRGVQASRSMPTYSKGPPKKQPSFNAKPKKKLPPQKRLLSTSQHSTESQAKKKLAQKKFGPSNSQQQKKSLLSTSQHSTGGRSIGSRSSQGAPPRNFSGVKGRGIAQTKSMPVKKLTPLQASKANQPKQPKNPPRINMSGTNGRKIAGSKSMPMHNIRKPPPRKISVSSSSQDEDESEVSSVTEGNYPQRPKSCLVGPGRSSLKGKTPERGVARAHSNESLTAYGRAGKIKFKPKPKPKPTMIKMKTADGS
ncbi:MAG: hypothetical protein SGILL_001793 [Bacillariaceae sp.]